MTEDACSSTHPPLPPTTEEDQVFHLRLLRSHRVGPVTYHRLLGEYGSARRALEALPDIAAEAGVKEYSTCSESIALTELKRGHEAGATPVFAGSPDYPTSLSALDDAPGMFWAIGDLSIMRRPCVALVGARDASSLGTRMARKLAQDLGAAGYVIVSGLARGIDAAAHDGALDSGTIAVQPGGVDVLYPAQNAELGRHIGAKGLRISEQPIGCHPQARHFIARNRIVTGLARAVVVVEAAARSGSLAAARGALDQGREVLAVPGHPFEPRAAGCNMLIRDGAGLMRNAQDVIELLENNGGGTSEPGGPNTTASRETDQTTNSDATHGTHRPANSPPAQTGDCDHMEDDILSALRRAPMAEDQLIRHLGQAPTAVAPILTDMELDGKLVRQAGGILAPAAV